MKRSDLATRFRNRPRDDNKKAFRKQKNFVIDSTKRREIRFRKIRFMKDN